jgi:alpha/beta superfamily hydrolase
VRSFGLEPFYFGQPEKSLLGLYQLAAGEQSRTCGVVLCYPMGREYLLAHRSFRQLATQLSQAGFPVLRFDFYGCGDSQGSSEEGSLGRWMNDLSAAVTEMRKRSGVRRICLVGLRVGATLAMNVGVERHDIDCMVLWNPVVSGTSFLREMQTLHSSVFKHLQAAASDCSQEEESGLLGFRLTDAMRADLAQIDLHKIRKKPASKILVIQSESAAQGAELAQHLDTTGAKVDSKVVPFASVWTEGLYRSHVPAPVLQAIVSWVAEVNA